MPLKNIFKSKDDRHGSSSPPTQPLRAPQPEFKFIRSDTTSEDVIHPPTGFPGEDLPRPLGQDPLRSRPRSSSSANRFRESFQHFGHRRSRSITSSNIPADLPNVNDSAVDREAQWEKRATVLVGSSALPTPSPGGRSRSGSVCTPDDDENIQEAIRLHEAGEYECSTAMFGRLADPKGPNNPLSQVLYGLALRHGWGIDTDPAKALTYLRAAAKNSAEVEQEALRAGMTKGGSAKGELVLAMYELGNSYRQGWGVDKDPVAAREFYETAANLGDSDAQNEVGWCYVEGFGCKKDKKKAAKFYRMAEKQGNKTLGNSWIYKDKYMDGEN